MNDIEEIINKYRDEFNGMHLLNALNLCYLEGNIF